jgi:hypothetical protein
VINKNIKHNKKYNLPNQPSAFSYQMISSDFPATFLARAVASKLYFLLRERIIVINRQLSGGRESGV